MRLPSPLDAAPDARGRLVVSLLAEERLSFAEIAGLHDRDVSPTAMAVTVGNPPRRVRLSKYTKLALADYLAERPAEPGPLIRVAIGTRGVHKTRTSGGLSVRWLENLVYQWQTGLDRRRREDRDGPLHLVVRQYVTERRTAGQLAVSTVPNTRGLLLRFANSVGGVEARKVTRLDVAAFVGRPGLAPSTRRRDLSVLRTFWRWLIVTGRADADPTLGVDRVREARRLPRGLRPDQVAAALAACPDARARLIVTLEVQLGLRAVEVARLRLEDIDRHERTVRIVGKGSHERVLPVVDEAWEAMAAYLAEWPATRGPLIRSYNHPDRGVCASYIAHKVAEWMHAAEVGESGHALRHTMATDLLRRGIDVKTVSASLGHANVATTSRYLPLVVTPLRDAMEGRRYGPAADQ